MNTKNLLLLLFLSIYSVHAQKINGVSFVASGDSIRTQHIQPVVNVNANYVAIMPFGFSPNLKTNKIYFNGRRQWFGEREEGVIQYARQFRKRGIRVMLKPQLWVRGNYTGHIKMDTEEDWKLLEKSYDEFILFYAKVAQKMKADILCIGTELEQFVINRPQYWKLLIQRIRDIYKGKLTYASNWDEFKRVTFWNQLDYIGVDAYFPLSEKKTPSIDDFQKGWQPHKSQIVTIQKNFRKPILFTEFGYRSVNYTGKEPWDSSRVLGEVNFEGQTNGLQAIYNEFWKEDWFAGGFIWKWFVQHDRVGGVKNNRFTPQNKPAEELLSKLYKE